MYTDRLQFYPWINIDVKHVPLWVFISCYIYIRSQNVAWLFIIFFFYAPQNTFQGNTKSIPTWIRNKWFPGDILFTKYMSTSVCGTGIASLPVVCWFRVALFLVFCVMFYRSLFVLFLLSKVLSVLPQFTTSDYLLVSWNLSYIIIFLATCFLYAHINLYTRSNISKK